MDWIELKRQIAQLQAKMEEERQAVDILGQRVSDLLDERDKLTERLTVSKSWLEAVVRHFDLSGASIFDYRGSTSLYYGIKKFLGELP